MFAEGEAPGQTRLDDALASLADDTLNEDMQALLAPVFRQLENGATPDELLGMLAQLYPQMDASGLQERLARIIFVSQIWGKIHASKS